MGCTKYSEKQRRFVFYLRSKYKTKKDTPKKYKWIWDKKWTENEINNININIFDNYIYELEQNKNKNINMTNEAYNISIPYDIKKMSQEDLLDALFIAVENEDAITFKRVWGQLSNIEKFRFIKNFKGKYTKDTYDKMYFILQTLI